MEKAKRSRGNPGKDGTLDELLSKAFSGLHEEVHKVLLKSIEKNVFSGSNSTDVYKNFRAGDIRVVEAIYGFLKENEGEKDVSTSSTPEQPISTATPGVSSGSSSLEANLKEVAFPPSPPPSV